MPATLPQLLRLNCLHAPSPLSSPLAKPHHPVQLCAQPPQPTTRKIINAQPAFASTGSQRSSCRCTQRTMEVQRRQQCQPSETRCERRCPSCSDRIVCTTTAAPRIAPRKTPTPATAPARNRPSAQHATSSMQSWRWQAPAPSAAHADARSAPPRSSDVSCVIHKRLGASDPAPSAWISLTASTDASRPAPRKPHRPRPPHVQPLQRATRNNIYARSAIASNRSQRSSCRCTQAYR